MYLFSRRGRLAGGNSRGAMAWAVGMTEKVNQITELDVTLYSLVYGPEAGTVVWSALVPDLQTLQAAGDKLLADNGYVAAADEGAAMLMNGPDDALLQLIYGEADPGRVMEYATTVQAVCANGHIGRGMELGVEIAQRVEKVTGAPSMFFAGVTGPYGNVLWVSTFPDAGAMESAQQALMSDTGFTELVDREAGQAYADEPGLTTQLIYRRAT